MATTEPAGLEGLEAEAREVLRRRAASLAQENDVQTVSATMGILTFPLGGEWYGVHIGDVREIYSEYSVTPLPSLPMHILGVINIRGEIVSVTDLARLLDLAVERTEQAPVVIVGDERHTALVVDAIGDIVEAPKGAIEPSLAVKEQAQAEYVKGSVSVGGRLIALIDLERVLAPVGAE